MPGTSIVGTGHRDGVLLVARQAEVAELYARVGTHDAALELARRTIDCLMEAGFDFSTSESDAWICRWIESNLRWHLPFNKRKAEKDSDRFYYVDPAEETVAIFKIADKRQFIVLVSGEGDLLILYEPIWIPSPHAVDEKMLQKARKLVAAGDPLPPERAAELGLKNAVCSLKAAWSAIEQMVAAGEELGRFAAVNWSDINRVLFDFTVLHEYVTEFMDLDDDPLPEEIELINIVGGDNVATDSNEGEVPVSQPVYDDDTSTFWTNGYQYIKPLLYIQESIEYKAVNILRDMEVRRVLLERDVYGIVKGLKTVAALSDSARVKQIYKALAPYGTDRPLPPGMNEMMFRFLCATGVQNGLWEKLDTADRQAPRTGNVILGYYAEGKTLEELRAEAGGGTPVSKERVRQIIAAGIETLWTGLPDAPTAEFPIDKHEAFPLDTLQRSRRERGNALNAARLQNPDSPGLREGRRRGGSISIDTVRPRRWPERTGT